MLFLANENFPLESIQKLREEGYNVDSIIEDSPGIAYKEILFQARKENTAPVSITAATAIITNRSNTMGNSPMPGITRRMVSIP